MRSMRFNHMELTFPRDTFTDEVRADVDAFYGDVFGWKFLDTTVVGQLVHLCQLGDTGDFKLLAESDLGVPRTSYRQRTTVLTAPSFTAFSAHRHRGRRVFRETCSIAQSTTRSVSVCTTARRRSGLHER
jgi:hypothetical protein